MKTADEVGQLSTGMAFNKYVVMIIKDHPSGQFHLEFVHEGLEFCYDKIVMAFGLKIREIV